MLFSRYNAPPAFQTIINPELQDLLHQSVIPYTGAILIISVRESEYIRRLQKIRQELCQAKLCVSIRKSCYLVTQVESLIITSQPKE